MLAHFLISFVANDLDRILDDPKLAGSIVSCTVADETGKLLYERNSKLRVMPASNQKLLSNSFALYKLGPEYRPLTKIWKGKDHLVVDSPGDPMMTHERLETAAATLNLRRGEPVFVHEAYRPVIGPSWEWNDLPNRYAAPVTAFTVDQGSTELWAEGERLSIEPRSYWLKPVRGAKSGKREVIYDPVRRTLTVNGELPKTKARIDTLALDLPDVAAAAYLGSGFRLTDEIPKSAPDLVLVGPPLKETIKQCLVHSDNNLAENLLLMAAAYERPLGNDPYAAASQSLLKFLTSIVGAAPEDFHPEDGSGLSRHDLVTTLGIVKLLQWAQTQSTRDIWLDALAKPGAGTLSTRLKDVPFVGKTGSLDMVAALSGYVHTKKDRTLTVSIILNHFTCSEREARSIADELIKKLVEDDGFGTLPAVATTHEARSAYPRSHLADAHWHS